MLFQMQLSSHKNIKKISFLFIACDHTSTENFSLILTF